MFRSLNENSIPSIEWDSVFSLEDNVDQIMGTICFVNALISLYSNKHAPYISVRRKMNGSPWINDEYPALAQREGLQQKEARPT